ncbi:nucleoporin 107 [Dictyostelium discoideum AX4]|uniref:Nuclear pore complex protein n=1 Tax=Dictyostelium discoideum TaxID=44689 RepID=Q54N06_DICDI|nr:nucleoporin 107 [Dictyostelium discoideum AX4]EAL64627.1 nucleoporin 107 [Dictyostelium discoideum AX4]|eukprot:XP_638137.1 nucleoporin 107 [Dictyostelium discoideum AX4]
MSENFKWNLGNNLNSNNNDDFFSTQPFNNNNKFDFSILPDDNNEDEFSGIVNNNNNMNNNNTLVKGDGGIFGNTQINFNNNNNNNNQFGNSLFGNTINNNNNNMEVNNDNDNNNNEQEFEMDNQQLQNNQMEMEEDENQFNNIFNDKSRTDDTIYHNTLEYELQPKLNDDPHLIPIELSDTFLKLSQAKINSINDDESNKLFYMQNNRKQKEQQLKNYQMEKDTWSILKKLYEYRDIQRSIDQKEKIDISQPNQVQVYNYLIKKDHKLRENLILLEWLEEMSSQVELNDNDAVFWEYTLIKLKKSNSITMLTNNQMVSELDPDAMSRQNKPIDKDDEKNQSRFLKTVWSFLRAGDRVGAAEYCTNVGQFWRAQTLIGLNYYQGEHSIGNPYFNLWKSNCLNISKNSNDQYERAIYGLLCGNLEATLPIQKNWYDYFWCYLRVLYDESLYRELKPYRSPLSIEEDIDSPPSTCISQINTPKDILEILKNNTSQIEIKNQSENPYHQIQELIIADDYSILFNSLPNLLLKNKTPEFNRFAVLLILFFRKREQYELISTSEDCPENIVINEYVQHLINSQQYELVALYTSLLNNESLQVDVYSRFLVNIIDPNQRQQLLVLAEKFGLNTQEIAQSVVKTITSGSINTTSNSFENLEFTGFATTINKNKQPKNKSTTTTKASTTETTTNTNTTTTPNLTNTIINQDSSITTQDDLVKINSIQWLCFEKQLLIKAILQSNLLLRDFISLNKYGAASELLKSLPKDIVMIAKQQSPLNESDTNNIIKEFRDWENYITANIRINLWLQNYSNQPKISNYLPQSLNNNNNYINNNNNSFNNIINNSIINSSIAFRLRGNESYAEKLDIERRKKEYDDVYGQWNQNNINFGKEAIVSIRSIIKTGWLCPLENQIGLFSEDDQSGHEVTLIRKKCIPSLFKSLYTILVGIGSIQKSSQLCNQIANERFRWYSIFSKKELQEILQLVRESSIKLLN